MKIKRQKLKKALIIGGLSLTLLVGYADQTTTMLASSSVRFGDIRVSTNLKEIVEIEGDQIYFIADGSYENITDACSNDNYYIKEYIKDNYKQTIVVAGEIPTELVNDEISGFGVLGFVNTIELIGEFERDVIDGYTSASSTYGWPSDASNEVEIPPLWFKNYCDDYGIDSYYSILRQYNL